MKSLPEFILDEIALKLATVATPTYRNTFAAVEKDTRASSERDLADGPVAFVCYAGASMKSFGRGVSIMEAEYSIEVHAEALTGRQLFGLGLVGDIKAALLADKTYLDSIAITDSVVVTSDEIRINDADDTVIAVVVLRVPFYERHAQIYFTP